MTFPQETLYKASTYDHRSCKLVFKPCISRKVCILTKKTSKIDCHFCLWSFQNQKATHFCKIFCSSQNGLQARKDREIKTAYTLLSLHAQGQLNNIIVQQIQWFPAGCPCEITTRKTCIQVTSFLFVCLFDSFLLQRGVGWLASRRKWRVKLICRGSSYQQQPQPQQRTQAHHSFCS